jgi:16S rRNA (cytosine1402-N4)-methyltransferase
MVHIPVLQKEVLQYLDPKPNDNFIDCTIDGGGHALIILEKIKPNGRILGIDLDEEIIRNLEIKKQELDTNNLILVPGNYVNLKEIVEKLNFRPINGILLDLGMSSGQLEESGRGFSFQKNEPLDMRYSKIRGKITAADILNNFTEHEIENILRGYGEERFSRKIAREIILAKEIRPVETTFQLVEIIKKAIPGRCQKGKLHFATRTFQALRITVNSELDNLKKVLPQAIEVLAPGGRIVIISFHSLEDRIVKKFFREKGQNLKILTKKPIGASSEETKSNSRSRSAKLRAALRTT